MFLATPAYSRPATRPTSWTLQSCFSPSPSLGSLEEYFGINYAKDQVFKESTLWALKRVDRHYLDSFGSLHCRLGFNTID